MTTIISNNKLSKLFICRKFVTTNSFQSDNNRAQKKNADQRRSFSTEEKKIYHRDARNCLVSGKVNNETQKYIFLRE